MNELLIFFLKAVLHKGHDWGDPTHRGKVSAHEVIPNIGTVSSYSGIPVAPRAPTPTSPKAPIIPTVPVPTRSPTMPTKSGTVLTSAPTMTRKKLPF